MTDLSNANFSSADCSIENIEASKMHDLKSTDFSNFKMPNQIAPKRAYSIKTPKFGDIESVVQETFAPEAQPDIFAFLRDLESRGMLNVRKETRDGAGRKCDFETDKIAFLQRVDLGEPIAPNSPSLKMALESGYCEFKPKLNETTGRAYRALVLTIKAHGAIARANKE